MYELYTGDVRDRIKAGNLPVMLIQTSGSLELCLDVAFFLQGVHTLLDLTAEDGNPKIISIS